MSGLCKDCKWWKHRDYYPTYVGECDSPKMLRGYHIRSEAVWGSLALVENDEGWGILTAQEFGCVNFEEHG